MIKLNQPGFLHRYVTTDEIWVYHFTPKSNQQSCELTAHNEPAPKREKTQQTAGEIMAVKGGTMNSDYYIALLDRLKDEIAEKRLHFKKNKVLLHQDYAPCQKFMNWASNCFLIYRIRKIWPPASISCSRISKKC
ncbi:hypothetical protein GWI33_009301 [Rhynchophorus ferrugineus]|uniref:Mariner transposase n=1 Tax=Rhynchophorus ferrugineus TaxID=354439 RepID=A0A834IGR8_RHYFE|nr:hypothetical protein GWI33_009301 [Rhynchophorus ferrugineus]